jgi:hypothetical protein
MTRTADTATTSASLHIDAKGINDALINERLDGCDAASLRLHKDPRAVSEPDDVKTVVGLEVNSSGPREKRAIVSVDFHVGHAHGDGCRKVRRASAKPDVRDVHELARDVVAVGGFGHVFCEVALEEIEGDDLLEFFAGGSQIPTVEGGVWELSGEREDIGE